MSAPTPPDPYRIKRILNKLETVWSHDPSMDLDDIVAHAQTDHGDGHFYASDRQIEKYLDAYLKKHSLTSTWKS
jgi:hypothetical protein